MLTLGTLSYPLCLLDTLAVSEMVKRPQGAFRSFLDWSHRSDPQFVPCFTVYTLIELRRTPELFDQFIEFFQPLPCVLLKGYMNFLDEEAAAYPDPGGIDPCAIAFTPLGGKGNQLSNIPRILALPELVQQEQMWNEAGAEIVEGMLSLVKNYPPGGETYSAAEVRSFASLASLTQLALHGHTDLIEAVHERGEAVETDAFPSLKAMSLAVFYKFYTDRNRKAADSDAFDVLITAALPYVEAVITENHLAEALRKTQRVDPFLDELEVFSLRDFRVEAP
jgi:hypothetical protein